jgi:ubiquinone biosynthesis protein Coq4
VGQRTRQTHDLWHVLTGLGTDIPGEIALQAFTYEQLHHNFSRLIMSRGQHARTGRARPPRRRSDTGD